MLVFPIARDAPSSNIIATNVLYSRKILYIGGNSEIHRVFTFLRIFKPFVSNSIAKRLNSNWHFELCTKKECKA